MRAMNHVITGMVAICCIVSAAAEVKAQLFGANVASCLHGDDERPAEKRRRESAVAVARQINREQANVLDDTGRYAPVERLRAIPPIPLGFALTLQAGERSYVFALKDRQDPCRFAVFSDSDGLVYQTSQQAAPLIARR